MQEENNSQFNGLQESSELNSLREIFFSLLSLKKNIQTSLAIFSETSMAAHDKNSTVPLEKKAEFEKTLTAILEEWKTRSTKLEKALAIQENTALNEKQHKETFLKAYEELSKTFFLEKEKTQQDLSNLSAKLIEQEQARHTQKVQKDTEYKEKLESLLEKLSKLRSSPAESETLEKQLLENCKAWQALLGLADKASSPENDSKNSAEETESHTLPHSSPWHALQHAHATAVKELEEYINERKKQEDSLIKNLTLSEENRAIAFSKLQKQLQKFKSIVQNYSSLPKKPAAKNPAEAKPNPNQPNQPSQAPSQEKQLTAENPAEAKPNPNQPNQPPSQEKQLTAENPAEAKPNPNQPNQPNQPPSQEKQLTAENPAETKPNPNQPNQPNQPPSQEKQLTAENPAEAKPNPNQPNQPSQAPSQEKQLVTENTAETKLKPNQLNQLNQAPSQEKQLVTENTAEPVVTRDAVPAMPKAHQGFRSSLQKRDYEKNFVKEIDTELKRLYESEKAYRRSFSKRKDKLAQQALDLSAQFKKNLLNFEAEFQQQRQEWQEYITRENIFNLEVKERLCGLLESLPKLSDSTKAIQIFEEVQQAWSQKKPLNRKAYLEISQRYFKATQTFREKFKTALATGAEIYKKTLEKREAIIAEIETLCQNDITNYQQVELKTQAWLKSWKSLKNYGNRSQLLHRKFKDALQKLFTKKKQLFESLKQEELPKITKKQALLEEIKKLQNHSDWPSTRRKLLDIHKKWRLIQTLPSKEGHALWKEFKQISESLFAQHQESTQDNLEKKQNLLAQTKKLLQTGSPPEQIPLLLGKLKSAKKRWNHIGHTSKKESQIATEFHALIDGFFTKNKTFLVQQQKQEEENFKAKSDLLDDLEKINFDYSNNEETKSQKIKEIQQRWKAIGPVGEHQWKQVELPFREFFDKFYSLKKKKFQDEKNTHTPMLNEKRQLIQRLEAIVTKTTSNSTPTQWNPETLQAAMQLRQRFGSNINRSAISTEFFSIKERWKAIGSLPVYGDSKLYRRYRKLSDEVSKQLKHSSQHKATSRNTAQNPKKHATSKVASKLEKPSSTQGPNKDRPLKKLNTDTIAKNTIANIVTENQK